MFSSKARKAQEAVTGLDFSQTARDASNYALGQLRELGLGAELSAMAFGKVFISSNDKRTSSTRALELISLATDRSRTEFVGGRDGGGTAVRLWGTGCGDQLGCRQAG